MKVKNNSKYKVNEEIEYDISNNTFNLIKLSSIKVIGTVEIKNDIISYDLGVSGSAEIEDESNFCTRNYKIDIKIYENADISEEIEYLDDRTLDLHAKIWDNIVVDILQLKYEYNGEAKNGDGWSFHTEEEEENKLDERLSPLLQLLEKYEEE